MARSTLLGRLLLAALQVALVLCWGGSARAEDGAPASGHRSVGMCGTLAQSIVAPPPIYPSSDAVAAPCAPASEELHRGVPLLPTDRQVSAESERDHSAVLPVVVRLPRRAIHAGPRSPALARPGEEHRSPGKRPPRS